MYYYNIIVQFMGLHTTKTVRYRPDFDSPISGSFCVNGYTDIRIVDARIMCAFI